MATTKTPVTIAVKAADVRRGDMAHRRNSELDARPVDALVTYRGRRCVLLKIGSLVTEPIPASLYTFTRAAS